MSTSTTQPGRTDPVSRGRLTTAILPARSDRPVPGANAVGLALAVVSTAACATSGTLGKALYAAGWSPGAAIGVRIGGGALLLAIPALVALRGRWALAWSQARLVTAFGLVAVAGSQLAYFQAIARLPIGVALLVEYLAPVVVVGWQWATTRSRPAGTTLLGAVVAVSGLAVMVDPGAAGPGSGGLDVVGLAWGLVAAVCLAVYFVLSARDADGLPGIVVVAGGMLVGAIALGAAGLLGLVSMAAPTGMVPMGAAEVSWVVPAIGLVVVPGALAYATGVAAARRLGARVFAFVSLVEVVFAVLMAWLWLSEVPTSLQVAGGGLIIGGVVLVRLEHRVRPRRGPGTPGSRCPDQR